MSGEPMTTDQGGEPAITSIPGGEPVQPTVPKELWPVIDDIVGKKTAGIIKRERETWEREAADKAKLDQMSEVDRLNKQLADATTRQQKIEADYRIQSRRAELLSTPVARNVPAVYIDAILGRLGPDDEFDANALAQSAYEQAMADAQNIVGVDPTKQKPKAPLPHGGTPHRVADPSSMTPEEIMSKARTDPAWYVKEGKALLDKIRLGR